MADVETTDDESTDQQSAGGQPPEDDEDLESKAIDQEGRKLVPLEEVAKLRAKRKSDKDRASQLTQENQQLKAWETYGKQAQQILEQLKRRPDVLEALKKQPGAQPSGDQVDPQLVQLAKSLDLYDANGQPDTSRAKLIDGMMEQRARKLIDETVAPLRATTSKDKSAVNFQRMAGYRTPNGQQVDPQVLNAVWQLVDPELSAQDEVAQVLLLAAAGYQNLFGQKPAPSVGSVEPETTEPVMTEPAGGSRSPMRLTNIQTDAAKEIGVSTSDFAKGIKQVMERGGQLE